MGPLRDALLAVVSDGAHTVVSTGDSGNSAPWEIEALGRLTS